MKIVSKFNFFSITFLSKIYRFVLVGETYSQSTWHCVCVPLKRTECYVNVNHTITKNFVTTCMVAMRIKMEWWAVSDLRKILQTLIDKIKQHHKNKNTIKYSSFIQVGFLTSDFLKRFSKRYIMFMKPYISDIFVFLKTGNGNMQYFSDVSNNEVLIAQPTHTENSHWQTKPIIRFPLSFAM